MSIRSIKMEDASCILEIYAPYVTDSATSFETEVPSLDSFIARIQDYTAKFPWIVFESEGQVVGYAYASSHRSRCAYEWSVECSVYINPKHHEKGIATNLYKELFRLLKDQGAVNVLAGITLPNQASIKLHESFGFEPIGKFKDVGFKQGQWWDVGWWQLQLQKPAQPKALLQPRSITA